MSAFEWLFLVFSSMFIVWRAYRLGYINGERDMLEWYQDIQRKAFLEESEYARKHHLSEN